MAQDFSQTCIGYKLINYFIQVMINQNEVLLLPCNNMQRLQQYVLASATTKGPFGNVTPVYVGTICHY